MEVLQKFKVIAEDERANFKAEILKCHNADAVKAVIDNFSGGINGKSNVFATYF